jgi:hypothetical protein
MLAAQARARGELPTPFELPEQKTGGHRPSLQEFETAIKKARGEI